MLDSIFNVYFILLGGALLNSYCLQKIAGGMVSSLLLNLHRLSITNESIIEIHTLVSL